MKLHLIPLLLLAGCTAIPSKMTLREGENWASRKEYANFELCGQARTEADAQALVRFCQTGSQEGYEVLLHNGPIDGTCKTGSLVPYRDPHRALHAPWL